MLLRQLRLLLTFSSFRYSTSFKKNTVHQTSYLASFETDFVGSIDSNASKSSQSILQMNSESAHLRRHPHSVFVPLSNGVTVVTAPAAQPKRSNSMSSCVLPRFAWRVVNLPRKNARNGIAPTLQLTKWIPKKSRKKSWDKLHITEAIG